jgi:hypothetical protein
MSLVEQTWAEVPHFLLSIFGKGEQHLRSFFGCGDWKTTSISHLVSAGFSGRPFKPFFYFLLHGVIEWSDHIYKSHTRLQNYMYKLQKNKKKLDFTKLTLGVYSISPNISSLFYFWNQVHGVDQFSFHDRRIDQIF